MASGERDPWCLPGSHENRFGKLHITLPFSSYAFILSRLVLHCKSNNPSPSAYLETMTNYACYCGPSTLCAHSPSPSRELLVMYLSTDHYNLSWPAIHKPTLSIRYFLWFLTRYMTKNNLRKRFTLVHNLKVESITLKSWQQSSKANGQNASTLRIQRDICWCSAHFLFSKQSRMLGHGIVQPHLGTIIPPD